MRPLAAPRIAGAGASVGEQEDGHAANAGECDASDSMSGLSRLAVSLSIHGYIHPVPPATVDSVHRLSVAYTDPASF